MNALVGFNTCLPGLRLYYAVFTRWPLLHAARDLPTLIPCQCEEIFIFEISNTPKRDLQYHSVTPKTSFRRGNMFGHLRLDQASNMISINTPPPPPPRTTQKKKKKKTKKQKTKKTHHKQQH